MYRTAVYRTESYRAVSTCTDTPYKYGITPYRAIPNHSVPYCNDSYRILQTVPYRITLYRTDLDQIIPYRTAPNRTTPCQIIRDRTGSNRTVPNHTAPYLPKSDHPSSRATKGTTPITALARSDTAPYRTVLYRIIQNSKYFIQYCTEPPRNISFRTELHRTVLYRIIPNVTVPKHGAPYRAIPNQTVPNHAAPYRIIPIHTVPTHAALFRIIPVHAVLNRTES